MIARQIEKKIIAKLFQKKAILLFGARQVGKTSLIRKIVSKIPHTWLSGDEPDVQQLLENASSAKINQLTGTNKILVIDEAQMISNIGLLIKRIVDNNTDLQVIAAGSSAFELADKIKESLVGRKNEFQLFPLSIIEMVEHTDWLTQKRALPHYLIFGLYPEVINDKGNEITVLQDLSEAFLFKDVLNYDGIKKSKVIYKLTQMLAFRIGSEINYSSLANELGINKLTVEKYVTILEQNFIIFTLNSFSKNLDNELKKGKKIYFWDVGIRNALIKNFSPLELRNDVGALWENFVIVEKFKQDRYENKQTEYFFWRTTQQQVIDLIAVENGNIKAFEIKYNPKQKAKISKTFVNSYNPSEVVIINSENFFDFLK